MPRKPRVQFSNAIYHIVTRGDGKQKLFHDDGHYQRFTEGLEEEVLRSGCSGRDFHSSTVRPRPSVLMKYSAVTYSANMRCVSARLPKIDRHEQKPPALLGVPVMS